MMHEWIFDKGNRVVAKLKNPDGSFKKSVTVPTVMYPLNTNNYMIFTSENTIQITDENVLNLIDTVKYKIGHCYTNTKIIVDLFKTNGYNIKSYVGWLFLADTQFPVHHCWAVLDDNKIIDLADDFTTMFSNENAENFKNLSLKESREAIISFTKASKNVSNSIRCYPIGKASKILYYVGSECDPDYGRTIYNALISQYPNHECQRNVNSDGYNPTHLMMKEKNLL